MVQREARSHFGCDTLEGAEIENQGGSGTAGSHWEKRLFQVQNKYLCVRRIRCIVSCFVEPQKVESHVFHIKSNY